MSGVGQGSSDELPRGWQIVPLGEIAAIQSGVTKNSRKNDRDAREVPYLRVANVQRGWLDLSEIKTIRASPEKIEKTLLRPGDVLFNEGGDRDKLGRGWIWNGEISECVHQNHVFRARPRSGVLPKYVSYFGNSWGQEYFLNSGKQTTNLASINQKMLKALPVRLAPLPEQRRIVDAIETQLTRLDAAVASLERVRANLKRARASVLKAAVEGRLVLTEAELARQEGRPYEHASMLLERILEERRRRHEEGQVGAKRKKKYKPPVEPDVEELGELPEGWVWASWSQVGLSQNGRAFPSKEYSDSGIALLRPGNLHSSGKTEWNEKNTRYMPRLWLERYPEHLVREGELVMNLTAQSLKDDFLGRICEVGPGELCLLNQRLARLTPVLVHPRYTLWLFKSPWFRSFVRSLNTGSLIQHMFTKQLEQFQLPLPPLQEQQRIASEIERRLSVIDAIDQTVEKNLRRCERLRQSILKRAFEGKLVPQDPNDEPASELLARIQAES